MPLGPQWPTVDPFLFCAHHDDHYPAATDRLGPEPGLLRNRSLGQDFSGAEGWSMYHGQVVPGFPQHPHRGFETISFVRRGYIDHSDSLGATARFGRGDVQWMTAGSGIVHSEMFPLMNQEGPNHMQMFQIWLNLPAAEKMVDPHFSMLWNEDIPLLRAEGDNGATTEITVIAGSLAGLTPPSPPPHSWASQADSDVAIWHGRMDAGASWVMPAAANPDTVRTLYLFEGGPLSVTLASGATDTLAPTHGGVLAEANTEVTISAGDQGATWMVLQGQPIGEPVAQYGPFVLNDQAGVEQAFADYQRTRFGGWPWASDDPNHGADRGRFARHVDGRVEEPSR